MLRPDVSAPTHDTSAQAATERAAEADWRVSSGSAAVLGLRPLRLDAAPTTAYLMLGERCARNCAFCTQARTSRADAALLSRVSWPAFRAPDVARAVAEAYVRGAIGRACLQVTVGPGSLERAQRAVAELAAHAAVPVCVSAVPRDEADVAALLGAGAERVTIALDAASECIYRAAKGGDWGATWALLEACARRFKGRIGTHLIVGLGETEAEMAGQMQRCADLGITIGLFAFTPVAGTALEGRAAPGLGQYRRMQAARWLIDHGLTRAAQFHYDTQDEHLCDYGLAPERLRALLADGVAFRTAGCADCNRPYYNERPGGARYNYPRPLTPQEAADEVASWLATL
jgi:lipoyl synthase